MRKFEIGDVVVHKGIKMTVEDYFDGEIVQQTIIPPHYDCVWFDDKNKFNFSKFYPNDLVSLENWEKILQQKERDKKLENILDVFNKMYRL